jgi:hypothetical protein
MIGSSTLPKLSSIPGKAEAIHAKDHRDWFVFF